MNPPHPAKEFSMVEVQLSKQSFTKPIVSFHANTVEFFYSTANSGGRSFHVGHIKTFELTVDKRGKYELVLTTEHHTISHDVDEEAVVRVRDLVTAVQQALKTVSL
jgi:hypothetical protein